jgi:hypothetical protein
MPSKMSWTEEDLARLKAMIESGASPARASVVFRRSVLSVQNQARKLGTPFPARRVVKRERLAKYEAAERMLRDAR